MCWLFGCQIYNFMGLLTFQHYHLDEDKKVGISLLPTPFLCSFSPSHFGIIPISYLRQSHSFLRHVCMTLYSGSHTGFANNCFFHWCCMLLRFLSPRPVIPLCLFQSILQSQHFQHQELLAPPLCSPALQIDPFYILKVLELLQFNSMWCFQREVHHYAKCYSVSSLNIIYTS